MELIPILLFWSLAVWCLWFRPSAAFYLFFGSMSFGSLAVVPPELTGGLTLTPTPVIGSLFAIKMLLEKGGRSLGSIALSKSGPVYLVAYWLVALVVTLLMPRIFEGDVLIIPVRLTDSTSGEPLHPTTQNFSQITYLGLSVLAVLAFHRHTLKHFDPKKFIQPLQFGGIVAIATGLLDYASQFVYIDWLLAPLRTATYALLTSDMAVDGKRVVGLMPEASAYGMLCIFFLSTVYFCQPQKSQSSRSKIKSLALVFALLGMIIISTSSSALVGAAVFFVATAYQVFSEDISRKRRVIGYNAAFLVLIGICVATAVFFFPKETDHTIEVIDEMVLHKTESASYEERTMWTTTSMNALKDTFGLGVGVGSTRTSNFLAAVFSNSGVLGGALFLYFLVLTLAAPRQLCSREAQFMRRGLALASLAPVSTMILAGTVPDFGMMNAYIFGLAGGLAMKYSPAKSTSRLAHQAGANGF